MVTMLFICGWDARKRPAQLASTLWAGKELTAPSCAALAHELVRRGVEDQAWQAIDGEGERLFGSDSLHRLAAAAPSRKAA